MLIHAVHVVDNRTIRVTLTFRDNREKDPRPQGSNPRSFNPKLLEQRAVLTDEVAGIEVKEGRVYVGPLSNNVSPNILEDHFGKFGGVFKSNVSCAKDNTMKKNFGVVSYRETQSCKRVLQNPRHSINGESVEVCLSKFCLEMLMSSSTLWMWEIGWSLEKEELAKHFAQFGPVFRAIHIFNPVNGEKKGYGLVDFVEEDTVAKACSGRCRSVLAADSSWPPCVLLASSCPSGLLVSFWPPFGLLASFCPPCVLLASLYPPGY